MKRLPRTAVVLLMGLSASLLAFQRGGFRQFMPSQPYESAGDSKRAVT